MTIDIEQLSIDTIRTLSMDAVQKAKSGHPGTPMGVAPVAYTLWQKHLRYDPQDPLWPDRDRFVLSVGHASMLLYSLLFLTGVKAVDEHYEQTGGPALTLDDIKHFRQIGSKTPGHPEYHLTSGVEPGLTRAEVAYPLVELLLPELEQFLVYVWRRQLAAVTGRVVQAAEDEDMQSGRLAVGFADLVGFTRLSRRLEEEELGELVENFEISCADIVAGRGGRLVKTLGDEILYVSEDAGTAAEIGLALVETLGKDESMPALRVGMAFGTVTTRMGDVFGTTVNLASRLTSIAPKDAVLVDGEMAAALEREAAVPPAATGSYPGVPPGAADALSAVASVGISAGDRAPVEPAPDDDGPAGAEPSYRFALQPMWRRPVRGLGLVEPWLLTRRPGPG